MDPSAPSHLRFRIAVAAPSRRLHRESQNVAQPQRLVAAARVSMIIGAPEETGATHTPLDLLRRPKMLAAELELPIKVGELQDRPQWHQK